MGQHGMGRSGLVGGDWCRQFMPYPNHLPGPDPPTWINADLASYRAGADLG